MKLNARQVETAKPKEKTYKMAVACILRCPREDLNIGA